MNCENLEEKIGSRLFKNNSVRLPHCRPKTLDFASKSVGAVGEKSRIYLYERLLRKSSDFLS